MKKTKDIRIGIVSSNFRAEVADSLEKHCLATFKKNGVGKAQVTVVRVPGALEIPIMVQKLAKTGSYDAIITFGAIVKGVTYHFEQISNECARGCMEVALKYDVPVIFEVLSVYDLKDALERAVRKTENKGVEAAHTALSMIKLLAK